MCLGFQLNALEEYQSKLPALLYLGGFPRIRGTFKGDIGVIYGLYRGYIGLKDSHNKGYVIRNFFEGSPFKRTTISFG